MRVLFTGASSTIGEAVLKRLLRSTEWRFFCTRHRADIRTDDPRVEVSGLDLASHFCAEDLPAEIDMVLHFAGITHARKREHYWSINRDATLRLAEAARGRGCERFVYISTRCATAGSGDYGESKLAAEEALRGIGRPGGLTIIRPSEVYGGGGNEGIDKFIELARGKRIVPMLFGDRRISFSPLHIDDCVSRMADAITERIDGIVEMCGPEELSGVDVAKRLVREFRAVPVPVWWPSMRMAISAVRLAGVYPVEPDQVKRLVCDKTCRVSDAPGLKRFFAS